MTTPQRGWLCKEVGKPITSGKTLPPPSPADLRRFAVASARCGYWLGSPEDNATVGNKMPS